MLAASSGVLIGVVPADSFSEVVISGLTVFLLWLLFFRWCEVDAANREIELSEVFRLALVTLPGPLIMIPVYLLRSRGWRGFISCITFFAFVAVISVIHVLCVNLGFAIAP